jgi:hypothetical protein
VVANGVFYALLSDARRRTLLPNGRDFASAGDEFGSALQQCVTQSPIQPRQSARYSAATAMAMYLQQTVE